jgi:hypothetical protein
VELVEIDGMAVHLMLKAGRCNSKPVQPLKPMLKALVRRLKLTREKLLPSFAERIKLHHYVKGACGSCPSSTVTMRMGIERRLMGRA